MFKIVITYRTGKTETLDVASFQALENGVVVWQKGDGWGFGRIYPNTDLVKKVEISFDNFPKVG